MGIEIDFFVRPGSNDYDNHNGDETLISSKSECAHDMLEVCVRPHDALSGNTIRAVERTFLRTFDCPAVL